MHLIAKEVSPYNEITVYECSQLYGEKGKYRVLQFSGDAIQGAMDLKRPERIVLEYPRAIIHLMEYNNSSFEDVFMIGHGIGTIAGHFPDKRFTVAEIDEKVVDISRKYFGYRADHAMIGDGRQLLAETPVPALDYIILDAFTKSGTPHHLTTLEFFELTKRKLSDRGAVMINLAGKIRNDRRVNAIHSTLRKVYTYTRVFFLRGDNENDVCNLIVTGSSASLGFQPEEMAGFAEIELEEGYMVLDRRTAKDSNAG
ncbi:fused MFS/spermidine synthase [Paenibacillus doosanensis]|uniref:Spermidine synthase n=1 Tax=Paenibacillus konkukensis TaxID=2020716 RepID=A0ABY4RG46_9BACL|nr:MULTISPECIES: fused MFS/spermidine synthase [Paenibacillus]MCS7463804.1 fused MFS/spermidine synthase [Paenibacillus doosanensis]UQZ81357.1 spermidine synthase [Paenibacillus konkukensis]